MKQVKCNKCNWVHIQVSREFAESEVETFNTYYNTLTEDQKQEFYGGKKAYVEFYEHCFRCYSLYKTFVDAEDKDVPFGSTIQSIINRRE